MLHGSRNKGGLLNIITSKAKTSTFLLKLGQMKRFLATTRPGIVTILKTIKGLLGYSISLVFGNWQMYEI